MNVGIIHTSIIKMHKRNEKVKTSPQQSPKSRGSPKQKPNVRFRVNFGEEPQLGKCKSLPQNTLQDNENIPSPRHTFPFQPDLIDDSNTSQLERSAEKSKRPVKQISSVAFDMAPNGERPPTTQDTLAQMAASIMQASFDMEKKVEKNKSRRRKSNALRKSKSESIVPNLVNTEIINDTCLIGPGQMNILIGKRKEKITKDNRIKSQPSLDSKPEPQTKLIIRHRSNKPSQYYSVP